jgi:hypothetical protein
MGKAYFHTNLVLFLTGDCGCLGSHDSSEILSSFTLCWNYSANLLGRGWPFTQGLPYEPGRISVTNDMTYPTPIAHSAEEIHVQALQMGEAAKWKEEKAIELRAAATGQRIGEKERLKNLDEATQLEEEAEKYRMEANRLRAEALHLDGELARELEDGGQASGVIRN